MTRLERIIGILLRVGVSASSLCLAAGLALSFVAAGVPASHLLLQTGVVVLLATPVARVAVSVVEYGLQRDWMFVTLTLTVLVELLASLVAAMYGRRL